MEVHAMASAESSTVQPTPLGAQITTLPSIALPPGFQLGTPTTVNRGEHSIEISTWSADEIRVCGTIEALVLHRLIQPEWLPGAPGNNSTSQTVLFGDNGPTLFRGNPAGRKFQEPLIRIIRRDSRRYTVRFPPSDEQKLMLEGLEGNERARSDAEHAKWLEERAEATERKREALTRASALTQQLGVIEIMEKALQTARQELDLLEQGIRKDPGKQAALEEASDGGDARFHVGDIAVCYGDKVIITGEFSYRRVNSNNGSLIDDDGRRIFYAWGYTARNLSGGNEYFWPAHELRQKDGKIKHLKLVSAN